MRLREMENVRKTPVPPASLRSPKISTGYAQNEAPEVEHGSDSRRSNLRWEW